MKLGIYRHHKGGYYMVTGIARDSTNGAKQRDVVVYIGLSEKSGPRTFVRDLAEFCGTVDRSAGGVPRFEYVGLEIP